MCEYQYERVSLMLKIRLIDLSRLYIVLVTLIDNENKTIHSYYQLIFVPQSDDKSIGYCAKMFNHYLLYSTRPKKQHANYSVRIDVFDQIDLIYLASWSSPTIFTFVPVHRLAAALTIPSSPISPVRHCSSTCYNGQCMKYMNKDKFF